MLLTHAHYNEDEDEDGLGQETGCIDDAEHTHGTVAPAFGTSWQCSRDAVGRHSLPGRAGNDNERVSEPEG